MRCSTSSCLPPRTEPSPLRRELPNDLGGTAEKPALPDAPFMPDRFAEPRRNPLADAWSGPKGGTMTPEQRQRLAEQARDGFSAQCDLLRGIGRAPQAQPSPRSENQEFVETLRRALREGNFIK